MPARIAASDRTLLLIAGAVIALFIVTTAVLSPPPEQIESPVPSTYSAQSAGADAAYRLLVKLRYPVRRWENSPTDLPHNEKILLILAEPFQPPSKQEREALANFVDEGGHVLFTGRSIASYFPDADLSYRFADPAWKSFAPNLPVRLTRGAQHVTLQPQAFWKNLNANQLSLYGDSKEPVVVSWSLGDGEILWWAGSTPLSNAGIRRDDNLAFFLNSLANWEAAEPYKIYWDEYFHGERSSPWSYIGKTSAVWSLAQIVVLALAILFTFSRRSGPIFIPKETSRLSPIEFVDTLGGLYQHAGAASSAIAVSFGRLRSLLTRQLGLPSNTPMAQLASAAESRLGWKDSGLAQCLLRANAAMRAAEVAPGEALEIVQDLEGFSAKLDLRNQFRREQN